MRTPRARATALGSDDIGEVDVGPGTMSEADLSDRVERLLAS